MYKKLILVVFWAVFCADGFAGEAPALATPQASFSEENLQFDFALGLLRRNLYPEAVKEFTKFLSIFPNSARRTDAYRERAQAAYGMRNYRQAANDYALCLQQNPQAALALRMRYAICIYELRRPEEARKYLESLVPECDREENSALAPAVYYYLAMSARETANDESATRYFKRVTDNPETSSYTPLALYSLGEIYLKLQQPGLAAQCFSRLIKDFPAHQLAASARLAESNALRQSGMLDRAIATFMELVNSPDTAIRSRARYGLACTLSDRGKTAEALAHVNVLLADSQAAEFHDGARYLQATLLFNQNKFTEALAAARRISPQSSFAENSFITQAWSLFRLKQYAEAQQTAASAAEKYPRNEDFPYLAGRAFWELEQYAQAAKFFLRTRDRAKEFNGKRAENAALEAAIAQEKAGQLAEALKTYEWLRTNYPQGASALDTRFGLGRTLMALGRHEASLPFWESLLKDSRVPAARRELALYQQTVAFYYLKQFSNLRANCQRLLKDFPQGKHAPDALYWLAWRDMEEQKYSAALANYQNFTARYPRHRLASKARYYTGAALLKLNREDQAAKIFYDLVRSGEALEGRELLWLAGRLGEGRQTQQAEEMFTALLSQEKEPLLRAVAFLGRAKVRRAAKMWEPAIADSRAALELLPSLNAQIAVISALENDANFGLAVALRENGQRELAAAALAKVKIAPDDPFTAALHLEKGLLAMAQGKFADAAELLLRVGILTADAEMAGCALWNAAIACERNHDPQRAKICYDELIGTTPGTFGVLHPDSPYRQKALAARARKPSPVPANK